MKEQENGTKQTKKEEQDCAQKQRYEKPRLKTVVLFADQVLGGCFEVFPNGQCLRNPRSS